ncbi:uncharacterized protein L3040_000637 [Drepanopeziza brunnea f. sp. 'multigermtubi']|uniref:uncharacterized protein n=1 Tax=Drepanopeziza brunnea f. sp. 'multigermtubi' TaxID=698441 RepID=UPI0023878F19|nr:hypothetical protein L3040_000637 [Drepanopeziza brunnea f. sp. 'multigermtubi']
MALVASLFFRFFERRRTEKAGTSGIRCPLINGHTSRYYIHSLGRADGSRRQQTGADGSRRETRLGGHEIPGTSFYRTVSTRARDITQTKRQGAGERHIELSPLLHSDKDPSPSQSQSL